MNDHDQPLADARLRGASAFQLLHWMAAGRLDARRLATLHAEAIARENPRLRAFTALAPDVMQDAAASDARRRAQGPIGRLDGLTVAVKDNIDVAGLPTALGLGTRARSVERDAGVVARLRAAGAVILGKTSLDEGTLGSAGITAPGGAIAHPQRADIVAGGSSAGSAVAVATGQCAFAIGTDTLGSTRIPASHCGVFGLRPTPGEIAMRGVVKSARRLDSVGLLARSVQDLALVLQVLNAYDPDDPRSRRRRIALAPPDWEPGRLRSGCIADLGAIGVAPAVQAVFARALDTLGRELGERSRIDTAGYDFTRMRRAGLLVMEAELALELAEDLADEARGPSPRLRALLGYAQARSAVDYAAADRMIDRAVVLARRLFEAIDVLVLPSVPHGPYAIAEGERANDADLTAFASLAGCPAISLPMGTLDDGLPVGLQLVGAPGSDLRLIDLAEVCAARLDAAPVYPLAPA
ncbi:MAG TPA: amidase [Dokdonella sp.]|uniref:amidase n=1 Tax=Dokdonella sp. TaxID=2291710 RepID=UPI0025C195E3|nr:amidase [Dokdonella sp.]MBX3690639.1 amidase [Dokdonella sp.]MCW5568079.1 amidase [Dokdonella sp.]HNR91640.1 amidase [Dokdonella sp.]